MTRTDRELFAVRFNNNFKIFDRYYFIAILNPLMNCFYFNPDILAKASRKAESVLVII